VKKQEDGEEELVPESEGYTSTEKYIMLPIPQARFGVSGATKNDRNDSSFDSFVENKTKMRSGVNRDIGNTIHQVAAGSGN
jgi:hypothetical protein